MKRSLRTVASYPARLLRALVLAPIVAYQRFVSPVLPRRCKYYPTCSAYAVEAIREVGIVRGSILAAWRVLRCNPFSHGGYDPVEDRPFFRGGTTPAVPGGEAKQAAGVIETPRERSTSRA